MVIKHWPGRTLTWSDNVLFTCRMQEYNPLYFDEEYAKLTEYKKCPMNPMLVFLTGVGLSVHDTSQNFFAALGSEWTEFHLPVFPGDSIYCETEVVDKRESKSRPQIGIVNLLHKIRNQKGEIVLVQKRSGMVWKKEFSPRKKKPEIVEVKK